jgi:hypothetical protein
MKHWLMKSEPSAYSIDDLQRDGSTNWNGVRNYQARNYMRDMKIGDRVLFYASNADPAGVTGIDEVSREARPEPINDRQRAMVERTMKSVEQQGVQIDRSRIPKTQPLVADFFFGDDETMWVMPFRGDGMMLDVFDADGRYLGEVRLPGGISPSPAPVLRGNRLVGVAINRDGIPSVAIYRVEKPGG